jgi:hypothetical protein
MECPLIAGLSRNVFILKEFDIAFSGTTPENPTNSCRAETNL